MNPLFFLLILVLTLILENNPKCRRETSKSTSMSKDLERER